MNKLLLISMLLLSFTAFAQDEVSEEQPIDAASTPALISSAETDLDDERHKPYGSHWLTSFGFETSKYEVPFEFRGEKKNILPKKQELSGGRLSFGGQIYLGAGFATISKLEGYYQGTLFTKAINGGPKEKDVEFASTKRTGSLWGVDATQSLSYIFEMKTKNPFMGEWSYLYVEPFIEAGLGKGFAYNSVDYKYLLITANESYRAATSDQFTNAKIGAGVNFTSTAGFFLFLKVTQNRYDVTDRKVRGASRANGIGTETSLKASQTDVKMDPVTIYALGGGYKF